MMAEVAVLVKPADEHEVSVDARVFAWRHKVYGPHAQWGGPADVELCAAAEDGARYALHHIPESAGAARAHITEIIDAPADTTPPAVKLAAAYAVWQAVDYSPADLPYIDPDGHVVFPD
ncbi:hypothetical protein [Actinospica robiniae]|uniref:hypothetical protein n=1 Tax=Actinospica robiniae TaxID=304901 RepID=UPI00041C3083|nr:hypothetical protein [Actinospica robiniae]